MADRRVIHPGDILQVATVGHGITHHLAGWKDVYVIRTRDAVHEATGLVLGNGYPKHYRVIDGANRSTVILGPGTGTSRKRVTTIATRDGEELHVVRNWRGKMVAASKSRLDAEKYAKTGHFRHRYHSHPAHPYSHRVTTKHRRA